MRVTNNMMINSLMSNMGRNLELMSKKQDEMATGKRIQAPSDDPVAVSKILKYNTDLAELDQYSRNNGDAISWLDATESAVSDINKVLQRMRELAVSAPNSTNSVEETTKIADEVQQLKKVLIANGNFSFTGKYVFSSFQTDQPLFKEDGSFNIDVTNFETNNVPVTKYQIGIGEDVDISTNGLDIFGYVPIIDKLTRCFASGDTMTKTGIAGVRETGSYTTPASLTSDYNGLTVAINGTTYTVAQTVPGEYTGTAGSPLAKDKLLEGIRGATNTGVRLDSVADVYYDESNKLVIKSKITPYQQLASPITLGGTGAGTITPSTYVLGKTTASGEINVTSSTVLTPTDVVDGKFNNKSYVVTFNGVTKKITLAGAVVDAAGLASTMNTALATAFAGSGVGTISVTETAPGSGLLNFTTSGSPDGAAPSLEVRAVTSQQCEMFADIDQFVADLQSNNKVGLTNFLGLMDKHINRVLTVQSDIGARGNRLELVDSRISENTVTFTKLLSDSQDSDMAEVIMNLKNAENVYKSSLSAGARIIQPSLVDFLR